MHKVQQNVQGKTAASLLGADALHGHAGSLLPHLAPHAAPAVVNEGLQHLRIFFENLHDQSALRRFLRQDTTLHEKFFEQTNTLEPIACASACGSLDCALRNASNLAVARFLFAHILSTLRQDKAARDVALVAMQRGRFMELIAGHFVQGGPDALTLFMAGALSTLDVLCGLPLDDVLTLVDAPAEVYDILIGEDSSAGLGLELLRLARCIEAGDWDACEPFLASHDWSGEHVAMLYGKAAIWVGLFFD